MRPGAFLEGKKMATLHELLDAQERVEALQYTVHDARSALDNAWRILKPLRKAYEAEYAELVKAKAELRRLQKEVS
jgi:hypothetical protein